MNLVNKSRGFALTFIAALAFFVYREWVTQTLPVHLFFDEAYYFGWSQNLAWGYYSKPPVVAWLIRVTTDIFGDSEWAIKLAAPFLYSITSLVIFKISEKLHSPQSGLYAAFIFLSMPLVSFNSLFITTDAPLLFFWACALSFFLTAKESDQWRYWITAGIMGGFGLLSKYTFILFPAGFLIYGLLSRDGRVILSNPKFWVACTIALLMLAPNLIWNFQHDFISFQHTADIAQQQENTISFSRMFEFWASQFIVFGPIATCVLIVSAFYIRKNLNQKLMWSILLPIFLVISIQALSARANINWSAPAYISGSIAVGILLAYKNWHKLFLIGVILNIAMMFGFYHYNSIQSIMGIETTQNNNPYTRISGWYELGQAIQPTLDMYPDAPIASESRKVLAYLGYYRNPMNLEGVGLTLDNHITSQYELLYPIDINPLKEHVVVSEHLSEAQLLKYFEFAQHLTTKSIKVTNDLTRTVHVTRVMGWKGN